MSAMPWNLNCTNGSPVFDDKKAAEAVAKADFSQAVVVVVSEYEEKTKSAFTYVDIPGWRICVAGHVHRASTSSSWSIAGNCYIPGWNGGNGKGWQMKTPASDVSVIGSLTASDKTTISTFFSGDDRYPQPRV
jgi:hypothetical protein